MAVFHRYCFAVDETDEYFLGGCVHGRVGGCEDDRNQPDHQTWCRSCPLQVERYLRFLLQTLQSWPDS